MKDNNKKNMEIMKRKEDTHPDQDQVTEVLSNPSYFSFINKISKKRIESYTEVIHSEIKLMDALGTHKKTKERLKDIDMEVATEKMERFNKYREEQSKTELMNKKNKLAHLDIEIALIEKERKLAELKNAPMVNKKKSAEEKQEEILEEKRRDAKFKRKHYVIDVFSEAVMRGEVEEEYKIWEGDILKGRKESDLNDEERRTLENLKDARQAALDKLG